MTSIDTMRKFEGILERALQVGYSDDSIRILDIAVKPRPNQKINFLSDFFKISLKYEKFSESGEKVVFNTNVVIKTEPTNQKSALEIFRDQELFDIELMMYRDVLHKVEELTSEKIAPKFFYGTKDPPTFVMEDVSVQGYRMLEQRDGLSLKRCSMVITKMATLHGASVALCEKNPKLKSINGGIVTTKCPKSVLRLFEVSLLNISRYIGGWSNKVYQECSKKMEDLAGRVSNEVVKIYDYDPDEFCVINHGDCWINNFMFKDDERGEPLDVLLVDYQMSGYTSPAVDLLYFLNICPETDIKYDKDDYFLATYLDTLTSVMKSLDCVTSPPTMEDLKRSMYKRRSYAVFSGLMLFPRMMAKDEEIEPFDEVLGKLKGETKLNVFKGEKTIEAIKKIIISMNKRGYLD